MVSGLQLRFWFNKTVVVKDEEVDTTEVDQIWDFMDQDLSGTKLDVVSYSMIGVSLALIALTVFVVVLRVVKKKKLEKLYADFL